MVLPIIRTGVPRFLERILPFFLVMLPANKPAYTRHRGISPQGGMRSGVWSN